MTSDRRPAPAPAADARTTVQPPDSRLDGRTLLAGMVASLPVPTVVLDRDGTVLAANAALVRLCGRTAADLVRLDDIVGPVDPDLAALLHKLAVQGGRARRQSPLRHAEGQLLWADVWMQGQSGSGTVLCQLVDITARRDAEAALSAAEAEFRAAFDDAPIGMALVSPRGYLLKLNRAFVRLVGVPEAGLLGGAISDLLPDADDLLNPAPSRDAQVRVRRSDGVEVWVRVSTVGIGNDGRLLVQLQDVTAERHATERLHATVQELERSNADLEHFAHVAAHDLRAPVNNINGMLASLDRMVDGRLGTTEHGLVRRAMAGTNRMLRLIEDLLAYARVGQDGPDLAMVDAEELVADVVSELGWEIESRSARVTVGSFPPIFGDAGMLRQVMQNLIGNAIKFGRPDVPPEVTVTADREGSEIRISVADNGIGIPADDRERIFEVFTRLHGRGEYPGTGVGLAICHRIVERHGGSILVHENPAGGATFVVSLPAAPRQDMEPSQARVPPQTT